MRADQGAHTSLLDVLTCSLGGALLMFMILLAIAEEFRLQERPQPEDVRRESVSPFVIVATTDAEVSGGRSGRKPRFLLEPEWSHEEFSGEGFAVLYATSPPPERNQTIRVGSPGAITVKVICNGQTVSTMYHTAHAPGEQIRHIWPLTQDDNDE